MKFDFGYVFTRSAKILWKYKVLWIFSILSSCSRWGVSTDSITNKSNNQTTIVINQVVELGNVSIVDEDLGIADAFKRGWSLFKNNVGPVLGMAIAIGVISSVANFVLALPVFGISTPAMLAYGLSDQQNTTPLIIGGVCLSLYIPVYFFILGIISTYRGAAWTLAYQQLTKSTLEENTPIPDASSNA